MIDTFMNELCEDSEVCAFCKDEVKYSGKND